VTASYWTFSDGVGNALGHLARPDIYYAYDFTTPGPLGNLSQLQQPKLNDSGSLYFLAYPNLIDIVDVQHATLRMRFSLAETISNTATPFAIDSGGRYIYTVTNKGLTIIDLGQALLSIGSLNPAAASAGTQVVVRGSGFMLSTVASVGGKSATVHFTDENTLTVAIPEVPSGPADIVLTNSDGTTYTLENAVQIP
jgi:IPT/TIG domain